MPPWPADPSYSHFVGENILSADEIEMIGTWVKSGSPEGNGKKIVAQKKLNRSFIGKPDLTLKVPPYNIGKDDKDRFLLIKTNTYPL